jgi:hypothetical protein
VQQQVLELWQVRGLRVVPALHSGSVITISN